MHHVAGLKYWWLYYVILRYISLPIRDKILNSGWHTDARTHTRPTTTFLFLFLQNYKKKRYIMYLIHYLITVMPISTTDVYQAVVSGRMVLTTCGCQSRQLVNFWCASGGSQCVFCALLIEAVGLQVFKYTSCEYCWNTINILKLIIVKGVKWICSYLLRYTCLLCVCA